MSPYFLRASWIPDCFWPSQQRPSCGEVALADALSRAITLLTSFRSRSSMSRNTTISSSVIDCHEFMLAGQPAPQARSTSPIQKDEVRRQEMCLPRPHLSDHCLDFDLWFSIKLPDRDFHLVELCSKAKAISPGMENSYCRACC